METDRTTSGGGGGAATSGSSTKAVSLLRANSATPSLGDQCRHMNAQHRMAKAASERSQQLFFSVFFRGQGRTVVEAVIAAVRANGVVVFVPEYEVQGNVYLRSKDGGSAFMPLEDNSTGASPYNRSCAQQHVVKSQSCMVTSGRIFRHAPVQMMLFQTLPPDWISRTARATGVGNG